MRRCLSHIALIGTSLIICFNSFSQDFRKTVNFSVIYDHVIAKELPSYIEVPDAGYSIPTEGVYNKSNPSLSIEAGYYIETGFRNESFSVYSGFAVALRRLDISYIDENLYAVVTSDGKTKEVCLDANVKRDLMMLQAPVGMTFPVGQKFSMGFSIRNNFVIAEISHERSNNPAFTYKLNGLNSRSPTRYLPEVSGEATYRFGRGALSLKYIYGVRSIYPEVKNAYDQIITSKMNFSSVMLTYSFAVNNDLYSRDQKRSIR